MFLMSARPKLMSISEMIVQPKEEEGMHHHNDILLKFLFNNNEILLKFLFNKLF